jgi:hypothetical protein
MALSINMLNSSHYEPMQCVWYLLQLLHGFYGMRWSYVSSLMLKLAEELSQKVLA